MKRILFTLFILTCLLMTSASRLSAADGARIELFTPQGMVKDVRQVTVRFSEPMVPFGDPRLTEPFTVSCAAPGSGRWADSRNWVYDFTKDLPAGQKCSFTLKDDLKTLAGKSIDAPGSFSFSTGGPAVRIIRPYEGNRIEEDQAFVIVLDAPAKPDSIMENVFFTVKGVGEKIGIRILEGSDRKKILEATGYISKKNPEPKQPLLVIQAKQRFPNDAEVNLVWGKGVAALTGVETVQDQILPYKVRKAFTAQFSCSREKKGANCIPILPMELRFSAPVPVAFAEKVKLRGTQNRNYPSVLGDDEGDESGETPRGEEKQKPQTVSSVRFAGPFPEKAGFILDIPKEIKDEAGRTLTNRDRFPLSVKTDGYPPLAKFNARFGILELKGGAVLPVTLRNLEPAVRTRIAPLEESDTPGKTKDGETVDSGLKGKVRKVESDAEAAKVIEWLRAVKNAGRQRSIFKTGQATREFDLPKPGGDKAFEVVGIPLQEPGFYIVEMESRILGSALLAKQKPMYVPTTALVTNMSAHFKWGRESSLVWVTTLDAAEPVADADVTLRDCNGKVIWSGKTDGRGVAQIRKELPSPSNIPRCKAAKADDESNYDYPQMEALQDLNAGIYVFAKKEKDMTFVHSSWDKGIESWRFNLSAATRAKQILAHTVLDRSLLRAGETVSMKHIIRRHSMDGIARADAKLLPKTVSIRHSGSDQKYEFPLSWDANGIAETTWAVPKDAKLGNYSIVLLSRETKEPKTRKRVGGYEEGDEDDWRVPRWNSGSFRVEEFRVPLLRGMIQPPQKPAVNVSELGLDLLVTYLSGGGAGNDAVQLRTAIQPRSVVFEDYDDFTFANGKVKTGITGRSGSSDYGDESVDETVERSAENAPAKTVQLTLDQAGAARTTVRDLPKSGVPQDLMAELEFRDPNGEVQTVSSRIPLWPANLLIGIKPDSWAASKDAFKFQVAALDLNGKPAVGVDIAVELFQRKNYSHRKRLVGGFYSYEHVTETKRIGSLCTGKTDAKGLVFCDVSAPVSGNVILQASAKDGDGNLAAAKRDVWIAAKGEWWFDVSDNDRIDLLPEKKQYEAGDTAKFQVRMPFREATALITVEREGILETFVKKISGKNPSIEIPVKPAYAPNVFISALVVRGRIDEMKPTALIDLGKPAYKLGIAEVKVGWKPYELKVKVTSDRKVYKVRDKAVITIAVKTAKGKIPPKGSEVAIAAVDEGLLELMPNRSWNLLEAMMGRRGYEVQTMTAQTQVIGKRHFGLKAMPHGGGGGSKATRELFDTLLLWKGRVALDGKGEAKVTIPLNDSLTAFRIVAVASGGTSLFGTGQTSIRSSQDLMLLSGLPQMVRETDRFRAQFTVRNTTNRNMTVELAAASSADVNLPALSESLAAGQAKTIGWDMTVPANADKVTWEVTAREKGTDVSDRIKVAQRVVPAVPVRTFQATIAQVKETLSVPVERPKDAISGKGGLQVSLQPRLAESLGGVAWYMRNYPYTCMEQKVSRAVALRDAAMWTHILGTMPAHLDADGLLKYFPSMRLGDPTLTAYVYSIAHEADWSIPEGLSEKIEGGLEAFISGKIVRYSPLPTADLTIRKLAAVEALARTGKAKPDMLSSFGIDPNLWPTSAVLDWNSILRRVQGIPNGAQRIKETEQILRSRMNFQGTTMGFSTERSDSLWWLMISGDVNAVKTVLTFLQNTTWNEDMPRMVRGALGRQHRGAWNTTTANAWGVLAMEKFSQKFESAPVSGSTVAAVNGQAKTFDWNTHPKGGSLGLSWPKNGAQLTVTHQGTGRPWTTVQSLAAIPLKESFSSGYRIKKTLTPVQQKEKGAWSRGDVVRVRLDLESQADMTWVVVSDPIPAGASILGSGLGRDSSLLTKNEHTTGWNWPAFEERSFEAFRSYYEYVPKGKWSVEYTVRLNNEGSFNLPQTRVEAMYASEMFGESPNGRFEVKP